MENYLTAVGLVIGVISGLAGLLKTILEIRKLLREDKSLLSLVDSSQIRIAAGLTFIGVAAVFGVLWWTMSQTESGLVVQVWDIEQDEKHAVIASRQFVDMSGGFLTEGEIQQVGDWLVEQLGQKYKLDADELQIYLHVPADLTSGGLTIEVTPSGPDQVYFWTVDGGKLRVSLNEQALARLNKDFYLEIYRPGYERVVAQVPWGQALDENFTAQQQPIRIGIEEFEGAQNAVAVQLVDYLAPDVRLSITEPRTLVALRDKIAEENASLAENPLLQEGFRTSLGVDLIVSGRYAGP